MRGRILALHCDKAEAAVRHSVHKMGQEISGACHYDVLRQNAGGARTRILLKRRWRNCPCLCICGGLRKFDLESEKGREMECTQPVCEHPDF